MTTASNVRQEPYSNPRWQNFYKELHSIVAIIIWDRILSMTTRTWSFFIFLWADCYELNSIIDWISESESTYLRGLTLQCVNTLAEQSINNSITFIITNQYQLLYIAYCSNINVYSVVWNYFSKRIEFFANFFRVIWI